MYSLFVGADVSKDFFSVAGLDEEGKELFWGSYEMDSNGFSEFLKALSSHDESLNQVLVAMESTGSYHINLFSFLHETYLNRLNSTRAMITNLFNMLKFQTEKTKIMETYYYT